MFQAFIDDTKRWMKQPYREDGDVLDWFLFIGLWIVATYLWVQVLKRIA